MTIAVCYLVKWNNGILIKNIGVLMLQSFGTKINLVIGIKQWFLKAIALRFSLRGIQQSM